MRAIFNYHAYGRSKYLNVRSVHVQDSTEPNGLITPSVNPKPSTTHHSVKLRKKMSSKSSKMLKETNPLQGIIAFVETADKDGR